MIAFQFTLKKGKCIAKIIAKSPNITNWGFTTGFVEKKV